MSLSNTVNSILDKMHSQAVPSEKGSYGEEAVFSICEDFYQKDGGILIHSFSYRTEKDLAGNIKRAANNFYIENIGGFTEIDIILVTPYKLFPIEVKAYKANKITLTNTRITGCASTDKSPVHQNEMHCRHLYPHIFTSIPDGMTNYIVPVVVFADECTVDDQRTPDQKDYMYVTVLNHLRAFIDKHNTPYNNFILDLPSIELKLRGCMTSNEKFLPYVKR